MAAWRLLARSEHGVGVSRCPEGHIHVELDRGAVTLRFDDAHFLAFARTVDAAASTVAGDKWLSLFGKGRGNEPVPRH